MENLPEGMHDPRVIADAVEKRERVRAYLAQNHLDGVVISRRDQFAWVTSGGDNRVLNNSETGFGSLVITRDHQYLVAHSMDAARIFAEQIPGQGYELVSLYWHAGDPRLEAARLAGPRASSDTPTPGTLDACESLNLLHYPLTTLEIERCRSLGRQVDGILKQVAQTVRPGQTEREVAQRLHIACIGQGIETDVLIVGSDERISRYRHPLPTEKIIDRYVLLHPAARKWGLHANVSRSISFGQPAPEIERAYQVAATIEARIFAHLQAGFPFAEILRLQKQWYAELGCPDEWQYHFQGGPTGYLVVDTSRNQTNTCVQTNQAFDWFVTVTGAKVEELALLTKQGVELASSGSTWPRVQIDTGQGALSVPGLWIL